MSNKQDSKTTLWPNYHLSSKEQMFSAEEVNDFVKSAVEVAFLDGMNAGMASRTEEDVLKYISTIDELPVGGN